MKKRILLGGAIIALLTVYQNCGLETTHSGYKDLSSFSKGCQGVLMNAYYTTYYESWFRSPNAGQNCLPCHAAGGEAGPTREFASADFNKAFLAFNTIGRLRVQTNGLSSTHKPPHTGPHNQSIVDAAQATWTAAEAAARACEGSNEFTTSNKTAPATVYTTNPGDNANTAWPRLSWDLDVDVPSAASQNKVHMTISLEVRRFMDNTKTPPAAIGYQFRNPTVTVKAAGGTAPTYRIEGISMNLNDQPYTYMTAYTLLDATVNSTTGVNLAPNAAFAAAPSNSLTVSSADQFALRFGKILDANGQPISQPGGSTPTPTGPNIPARVTFADLQSANPTTGVFSRSCNNCHNANNRQGGLNITDYANASAVAGTIRSRMNNTANPMPPSGILSSTDRAVVDVWVNGGTPQN